MPNVISRNLYTCQRSIAPERILRQLALTLLFISATGFIQTAGAQSITRSTAAGIQEQPSSLFPINGCMVLHEQEEKLQAYIREHPEVLMKQSLQKQAAWGFIVGSKHSWWATDMKSSSPTYNQEYLVPSTCRAVGTNAYIFVEDSLWVHGKVNQAAVDSVRDAFDLRTPSNPSQGIYQTDVDEFGNPPDVDGDARIIILILDIRDDFSGSGGYVAGYFFNLNEYPDPQGLRRSNQAEIYYIDADPQNLLLPWGLTYAMSTTAHEFQHMIHWHYDPNEITFVNESCSTVAELICGYPYNGQDLYTNNTDIDLLGWSGTLADYSRATRWSLYLWNQFPNNYLKSLVANTSNGISGIDNALAAYSPVTSRRFTTVLQDWTVANSLNDNSYDSRYGYTYSGSLTKPTGVNVSSANYNSGTMSINNDAADYYMYTAGANLTATFISGASELLVRAIEVGPTSKRVVDVPLNSPWNEPVFGSTYTSITFDVVNYSSSSGASYSLVSTFTPPGLPSAPILLAPANGAGSISINPTLYWNTSEGATGYHLQVSKNSGFGTLIFDDSTLTATSSTIGTLGNDSTYYWRVCARNTWGWGGYSTIWSFTTAAIPPEVPVLSAPPDVSTGISVTPTLIWDTSPRATTYQLQVSRNPAFTPLVFDDSTLTTTSRQVGPLANETEYYWHVRAKNTGGWSDYSLIWYFVTSPAIPSVPTLLAPADLSTDIQVMPTMSWNPSGGATAYQLQVSTNPGFSTTVFDDSTITVTSQQIGPLGNDTTYYWQVRAKNAAGWSGYSSVWSLRTIVAVPAIPVLLAPANGSEGVSISPELSWNASTGASVYRLQLSKSADFNLLKFDDSTLTGLSQQVGPLGNDTLYHWRVDAKNTAGWGGFSAIWNFRTIIAVPQPPVLSAPGDGSVHVPLSPTLSWIASSGASTYHLQVSKSDGFDTLAYDDSTITSTSQQIGPLDEDTIYYWHVKAKNSSGPSEYSSVWSFTTLSTTAVGQNANVLPTEFRLGPNFPNPFNPSTTITFELPEEAEISLQIYDVMGRKLRTLLDVHKPAGYYHTVWDAKDDAGQEVSSGIYLYRFNAVPAGNAKPFVKSGKLILAK